MKQNEPAEVSGAAPARRTFRVITKIAAGGEGLASRHVSTLSLRAWIEGAGPAGPRGRALRELRIAQGLSLAQAAALLEIGVATLHRIEIGEASFVADEAWEKAAGILRRAGEARA